jgi:tetratricopeptide (TPR) repeat protein
MKKGLVIPFLLLFSSVLAKSADPKAKIDSLYNVYTSERADTSKVKALLQLSEAYSELNKVKGLSYTREALEISGRLGYDYGLCTAYLQLGDYYYDQINYADAVKNYLKAIPPAERAGMNIELSRAYNAIGIIYSNQKKDDQALRYFLKVAKISESNGFKKRLAIAYNNLGITYKNLGRLSEATEYYKKALKEFDDE